MARRKREIQKRKKQVDSGVDSAQKVQDAGTDPGLTQSSGESPPEIRHTDHDKRHKEPGVTKKQVSGIVADQVARDTWFSRNKENLLLSLLILYVLLLGLGTAGELFEIEWILNLPLFK